jgi:ADP-heptose:LPS heptosyltransferase
MLSALVLDALTLLLLPWLILRRHSSASPERILVIQLGKIGDLVCTTPLLTALRRGKHGAHITVLCNTAAASVLDANPDVDDVVVVDGPDVRGLCGRVRLLVRVRSMRYTTSIAVLPGTFNAVIGMWTGAARRVHTRGDRVGLMGLIFHYCHSDRLHYTRHQRTFEHYMNIARVLGVPPVPYGHTYVVTPAERDAADQWMRDRAVCMPFVILALSAGNRLKEWPVDRFCAVATGLQKRGIQVVFSSSDAAVTKNASETVPASIDAGGLDLRMLGALIARASLFISVDTGPLYIAHALQIPLVDIVGPVDPGEQPPIPSATVELVLPPSDIRPSSFVAETLRQTTLEQRAAIEATEPSDVLSAADRVLKSH